MNRKKLSAKRRLKRKSQRVKLVRFFTALSLIIISIIVISLTTQKSLSADEAGENIKLTKYYKTITIKTGDSLWSIANEYKSGDYKETTDYVNELKIMNNLSSDTITAGENLVVAYFVAE